MTELKIGKWTLISDLSQVGAFENDTTWPKNYYLELDPRDRTIRKSYGDAVPQSVWHGDVRDIHIDDNAHGPDVVQILQDMSDTLDSILDRYKGTRWNGQRQAAVWDYGEGIFADELHKELEDIEQRIVLDCRKELTGSEFAEWYRHGADLVEEMVRFISGDPSRVREFVTIQTEQASHYGVITSEDSMIAALLNSIEVKMEEVREELDDLRDDYEAAKLEFGESDQSTQSVRQDYIDKKDFLAHILMPCHKELD